MIPVIITALYFLIYFNRKKIKFYKLLKDSCKFKINSWFKSIIFPILSMILIWTILLNFYNFTHLSYSLTHKLTAILFNPFAEEVIFRGIFLGTFAYFFIKKTKNYTLLIGLASIIISLFFSFQHNLPNNYRYLISVFWCFLYLWDDRNLTPAVVAHTVNNIIAILFV